MADLTTNQKSMVGYMVRSDQHAAYGFELILKSADPVAFFEELYRAGLFDPGKNLKPQRVEGKEGFFRIPYWTALTYLKRVAVIAGERENIQLGTRLMEIVRAATVYLEDGERIDNHHTYSAFAEILSSVPTASVTLDDISLIPIFLTTLWGNSTVIPELEGAMRKFLTSQLPDDHAKAVRLLEHVTELRAADDPSKSRRTHTTIADAYWLEQLLGHHAVALGEKARRPALDCLLQRLRQLFGEEFVSQRSWLKRPAVEDHPQNHGWDHITNAFVNTTRDALNAWIATEPESARAFIKEILVDASQIVRRIAINAIRTNWDSMRAVFEDAISPSLFDIGHLHELYLVLRERFAYLSEPVQTRIVDTIGCLTTEHATDADPESLERAQLRQRNWLDAIYGLGNVTADEEYDRLTAMFGRLREHPEFLSYHTTWVGTSPSPYTPDELIAFSDDKTVIQRVDGYTPPKHERGSSRKSLIDTLSEAVQAKPERFLWTLSAGIVMSRRFQYGIIHGFAKFVEQPQAAELRSSQRVVLNVLLPYVADIMSSDEFWTEAVEVTEDFEPNKDWIPPVVAELVKKLAANDEAELTDEDFRQAWKAVLAIRTSSTGIEDSDDPMTAAINNARGMSIEALLQIVLRRCRDADKRQGMHRNVWETMREELESELFGVAEGRNLETSTLLACYLAQLLYVDEEWVSRNMDLLFPFQQPKNLICAIAGLSFTNASTRVYHVLTQSDVPLRALRLEEVKGSGREHLIERLALAYIWGDEQLDSQVLTEMFSDARIADLVELTSTVSRWSDEKLKPEQIQRAKQLASAVVDFGLKDVVQRQSLLAAASRFIAYTPAPSDDDMRWLLAVAPYAHAAYGDDHFLEALDKIASSDADKAFAVLDAFLKDYEYLYDFRNHLQSIIRKLNASGLHAQAIGIVEQIVRKGAGTKWIELYKELVE